MGIGQATRITSSATGSLKKEIEEDVRDVLPEKDTTNPIKVENLTGILSEKLTDRIEKIMAVTEERMLSLTDSFVTGNIEVNNQKLAHFFQSFI